MSDETEEAKGPEIPNGARRVVGCMTGTSLDAVDAALVVIEGEGVKMKGVMHSYGSRDLGALKPRLRAAASGVPLPASEFATLASELAKAHIEPIAEAIRDCPTDRADLICLHGQTVFHQPPLSWQLINPAVVAHEFGCPVWHDLRAADLACGGQGAPITPLADWVLLRAKGESRSVVNLGGFCNVTHLPDPEVAGIEAIRGGDVCACNHVLDAVARETIGEPFDKDGRMALAGKPERGAVNDLRELLAPQSGTGRSLGTGDEMEESIRAWIAGCKVTMAPQHIAASAVTALVIVIGEQVKDSDCVLIAGGGCKNVALQQGLMASVVFEMDKVMMDTGVLGIPVGYREAACFAVLAALCEDGVPITLPRITKGADPAPRAGSRTYIPK